MIIDAHHHVWTLARGGHDSMCPDLLIYRNYGLDDLRPLLGDISATVLAQAAATEAETWPSSPHRDFRAFYTHVSHAGRPGSMTVRRGTQSHTDRQFGSRAGYRISHHTQRQARRILTSSFVAISLRVYFAKSLRPFPDFAGKVRFACGEQLWQNYLGPAREAVDMIMSDAFSDYYAELLQATYDCVDRIVLNAYFPFGQTGGGVRTWWRWLHGDDLTLDDDHLRDMAGTFSRRLHAFQLSKHVPPTASTN